MLEWLVDDEGNVLFDDDFNALTSEYTKVLQTLINNIMAFLNVSSLDVSFVAKVLKRLETFMYEFKEGTNDDWLIAFAISKVESHIKTVTNCKNINSNLIAIAVDRVCGEFLYSKKQTNQLSELPLDLETAVKSVQIGDTNITFAIGEGTTTDEQKFDALIAYLVNKGENEILCYRRISW